VVNIRVLIPRNAKRIPPADGRGAIHEFFNIQGAKSTIVPFLLNFVSPFQDVYCVQPIIKEQPSKKIDLRNTLGIPDPNDRSFREELTISILIKLDG
jgi:hypothetical protein